MEAKHGTEKLYQTFVAPEWVLNEVRIDFLIVFSQVYVQHGILKIIETVGLGEAHF